MKNIIYSFLSLSILALLAANNLPKKTYAEGMKGKYLLTIDRKGQGPGEFQNVWTPRFYEEKDTPLIPFRLRKLYFYLNICRFLTVFINALIL